MAPNSIERARIHLISITISLRPLMRSERKTVVGMAGLGQVNEKGEFVLPPNWSERLAKERGILPKTIKEQARMATLRLQNRK